MNKIEREEEKKREDVREIQKDRQIDGDEKGIKRSQDRQKCNENDRKRQREKESA